MLKWRHGDSEPCFKRRTKRARPRSTSVRCRGALERKTVKWCSTNVCTISRRLTAKVNDARSTNFVRCLGASLGHREVLGQRKHVAVSAPFFHGKVGASLQKANGTCRLSTCYRVSAPHCKGPSRCTRPTCALCLGASLRRTIEVRSTNLPKIPRRLARKANKGHTTNF